MASGFGLVSSIVPVLAVTNPDPGDIAGAPSGGQPIFKVGVSPFISPDWPGTAYAITSMFFCNRGNIPSNLTLYLVPKASAYPSTFTVIIKDLNIPPGDTFAFESEKIILGVEDSIWASCDQPASINAVLSVVRVA
jgi:hypothetical protein